MRPRALTLAGALGLGCAVYDPAILPPPDTATAGGSTATVGGVSAAGEGGMGGSKLPATGAGAAGSFGGAGTPSPTVGGMAPVTDGGASGTGSMRGNAGGGETAGTSSASGSSGTAGSNQGGTASPGGNAGQGGGAASQGGSTNQGTPCAGICENPVSIDGNNNPSVSKAICYERKSVKGASVGGVAGKGMQINGQSIGVDGNVSPWPASRNGGYCFKSDGALSWLSLF